MVSFILSVYLLSCSFASLGRADTLGDWIRKEQTIALDNLLANIAPRGRNAQGAAAGSVIASPSRSHPDYYYQWVRDAAITLQTVVDSYTDNPSSNYSAILDDYASLQYKLQHTSNPSGSFENNLSGLGEPKFNADGSAFTGSWGRPQPDGPALRAITLMSYVRAYNASHPGLWGSDAGRQWFGRYYAASLPPNSIVKADLDYVSRYWNTMGFDLWEEIQGQHFFTAMAQLRALREGADFARAFADTGAADWYAQQATQLQALIQRFWNAGKGHLVETLDGSRSGLDCALLLGSLHGSPSVYAKQQTPVFPPYSDEVLVSLLRFTQDQWTRFPINKAEAPSDQSKLAGVGLGRYPEDVYNGYENDPAGGHPWFLCTSSAAEVLYRTASHMSSTSLLTISTLNLPFYTALLPSSSPKPEAGRKYGPNDAVYQAALARLKSLGDEFLDVVRRHASAQGSMSEQFDRVTGFERGANDLTWSYGAFLQAARARDAVM